MNKILRADITLYYREKPLLPITLPNHYLVPVRKYLVLASIAADQKNTRRQVIRESLQASSSLFSSSLL